MKKAILFLLTSYLILPLGLVAQSLPSELSITADGRRLVSGAEKVTGFYHKDSIHQIEFLFTQSNYWNILDNNYDSSTDLMASVIINGVRYDSVGIRFKGNTSFRRNNTEKKSFNVSLDFLKNQDVMGYETLNLNCGFDDESSMRELVYNHIGRQFTPGLKSNIVELKINGQNWGPYTNVQQLNAEFLEEWFFSKDGTSWRALSATTGGGPGGGPGGNPFGTGRSSMNYNGPDSTDYTEDYELKRTDKARPWDELIVVTDKLNNLPLNQLADSLKYYLDVDKTLWFLAREIIFSDDDGYAFKGGMDYYVYWDEESGLMIPLEFDGNTCMDPRSTTWSPFYNEQDVRFPLINRLFAVPELRQRYLAHVRTVLNTYMDPVEVNAYINEMVLKLDGLVQNDPKRIYNYQAWQNGVDEVRNFISTRRNFLLNQTEVNVTGVDINQVQYAINGNAFQQPQTGDGVDVSAAITGVASDKVWLYYATGFNDVFEKTEMFDDGLHADGAAGDNVFGAQIPSFSAGTYVRHYIEGIAANSAKTATYAPPGAEHDVYLYQVQARASANTDIVINEFMASNDTTAADSAGEFDDWIELYNKSNQLVDLSGFFLSDKTDNLGKWEFPQGTMIAPNGYLIIWADEDGSQAGLHANFKLSAGGEDVILSDGDTLTIDQVNFGQQQTDMGYARIPNGTGNFVIQAPTFNANNEGNVSIDPSEQLNSFSFVPNPATDWIQIKIEEVNPTGELSLINSVGQVVKQVQAQKSIKLELYDLSAGIYFLNYQGQSRKLYVK